MPPLDQLVQRFDHSVFKLDLSGVVGLLGGNNAVDALETIHLHAGRRWAGWYNYPGSVTVAKRFGQIATSGFWDSLFPAPDKSPAVIFNVAGKSGPRYCASLSGTKLSETKYLGYLIAQECANCPENDLKLIRDGEGRMTSPATVTVISLPPLQHDRVRETLASTNDANFTQQKHKFIPIDPKRDSIALFALIPSLVSVLACVLCILGQGFVCFSLILLGMISSGVSSITLGAATLKIHVPVPCLSSPPGDGLLLPAGGNIIVLKGQEADVNIITKGEFVLDYSGGKRHMIGATSLLLITQSLVQLLLIPFSTLFGQILYLSSFIFSGLYHVYVVSKEKEKVQREILLPKLSPRMDKQKLGTRTQMAVFVCLVLGEGIDLLSYKPEEVFRSIIPNDTPLWGYIRRKVLKELALFWKQEPSSSISYEPSIQPEPEDDGEFKEYKAITDKDKELLETLIGDAQCVFRKYPEWRYRSGVWQERDNYPEEKARHSYYSRV